MTKTFSALSFAALILLGSCKSNSNSEIIAKSKTEIIRTEKAFADMAKKEGIAAAFTFYAADEAVIIRNEELIKGRNDIKVLYSDKKYKDVTIDWAPDFVDVSASGDLGYTYGNYIYRKKDSTGKVETFTGVFHTVWKKQTDGAWRFVWD